MSGLPRRFWFWLTLSFFSGFALAVGAAEAMLRKYDGDIRITAPEFHFLEGKPLERAKDGQSVLYMVQISLGRAPRQVAAKATHSFWLSYDLWEEKFVVTNRRERALFRSAAEAEAWCLARSPVAVDPALRNNPLWLKLEVWADETTAKEPMLDGAGVDLAKLIEIFSRNPKQHKHWFLERGPFQWGDLTQGT